MGAKIIVITKETMFKLKLHASLRKITFALQLATRSIVAPKGIIENVMVFTDS